MDTRKNRQQHKKKFKRPDKPVAGNKEQFSEQQAAKNGLELILKCDSSGCLEAITAAVNSSELHGVEIEIISSGIGAVNKSDIFMAETGSRLIVGFNVGIMPQIEQTAARHNVEIRLYDVIYRLLEDLAAIAETLIPRNSAEEILGSAKVIALFKSSRKGIILGCQVLKGKLKLGQSFRVVGAMGPLYSGRIESLHIEKDAVREATKGQQVGVKIKDFNKVKLGDLVESFRIVQEKQDKPWQPQGKIYYPD